MNGIQALYKCMEDPELELQSGEPHWYTYDEYVEEFDFVVKIRYLIKNDYKVRKRQSPIDACANEIYQVSSFASTNRIKEILAKHWPKGE